MIFPKKLAAGFFTIHFLRVYLAHLRLRDFRNHARLDADFGPGLHLLLGDNAQGKTNILEAIYLMATLRSFRGVGGAQMVRHGQRGYFVGGNVTGQGGYKIKMYWSARERNLSLDDQPVKKLADYLGALRTVVFCTEDLQLVKGTARARRRFLDLLSNFWAASTITIRLSGTDISSTSRFRPTWGSPTYPIGPSAFMT